MFSHINLLDIDNKIIDKHSVYDKNIIISSSILDIKTIKVNVEKIKIYFLINSGDINKKIINNNNNNVYDDLISIFRLGTNMINKHDFLDVVDNTKVKIRDIMRFFRIFLDDNNHHVYFEIITLFNEIYNTKKFKLEFEDIMMLYLISLGDINNKIIINNDIFDDIISRIRLQVIQNKIKMDAEGIEMSNAIANDNQVQNIEYVTLNNELKYIRCKFYNDIKYILDVYDFKSNTCYSKIRLDAFKCLLDDYDFKLKDNFFKRRLCTLYDIKCTFDDIANIIKFEVKGTLLHKCKLVLDHIISRLDDYDFASNDYFFKLTLYDDDFKHILYNFERELNDIKSTYYNFTFNDEYFKRLLAILEDFKCTLDEISNILYNDYYNSIKLEDVEFKLTLLNGCIRKIDDIKFTLNDYYFKCILELLEDFDLNLTDIEMSNYSSDSIANTDL